MKLESIGITLVSGRFANCQTSVCKQYIYIRYGDETAWDETARGRNDHKTLHLLTSKIFWRQTK